MRASTRSPSEAEGFVVPWWHLPAGTQPRRNLKWLLQRITKVMLWAYMRVFHDIRIRYDPGMPRGRSYVCAINHSSVLDVVALMVVDPYDPPTSMVIKKEIMQVPVVRWILGLWGAVPVERRGRDIAAIRQFRKLFSEGRGICVAPQGTRSPDGRLGPVNPVLLRIILQNDVAVFPTVIIGGMECMPKGAKLPRPGKIYLDTGAEIDLRRFRGCRLAEEDLVAAAKLIQGSIAALLPDYMKPDPTAPVLGVYVPET